MVDEMNLSVTHRPLVELNPRTDAHGDGGLTFPTEAHSKHVLASIVVVFAGLTAP
jgi:hypothetical protein